MLAIRPSVQSRPSFGASQCKEFVYCPYCWAKQYVPAFRDTYGHLFGSAPSYERARAEGKAIHKTLELAAKATLRSGGTFPFPHVIMHDVSLPFELNGPAFWNRQRLALSGMMEFLVEHGVTITAAEVMHGVTITHDDHSQQRVSTRFDLVGHRRGGRTVILDYKSGIDDIPWSSMDMGFRLNAWAQLRIANDKYGPKVDLVYLVPENILDGRRWWCRLSKLSTEMDTHGARCVSEMAKVNDSRDPLTELWQMGRSCSNCPTMAAIMRPRAMAA